MSNSLYTPGRMVDAVDESKLPAEQSLNPVHHALEHPYDADRWREDVRAMADGVPTGFDALDDVGMQWLPGKLTAVLARPGGGKTAWLLEATCRHLEANPKSHALFLSWEEPIADVFLRLLQRAEASGQAYANENGTGISFRTSTPLFNETLRKYARDPLSVDQRDHIRLEAAETQVRRLLLRLHLIDGDEVGRNVRTVLQQIATWMRGAESPHIGLVAIDYFQKLRSTVTDTQRLAELRDVADTLRRFAKGATLNGEVDADSIDARYAVPVIVGAQVNRYAALSSEGSGHPTGDQIREGDDLLNDAANVIALSWEESGNSETNDPKRWLRLSVPKHRGGRTRGVSSEEVSRTTWHPARQWISPHARHINGRIDWSAPVKESAPDAPMGVSSKDDLLAPKSKRGRS